MSRSNTVPLPRWVLAGAAAGALFLLLPLAAVAAEVNWAEFIPLVTSESSLAALSLSLRTAAASTLLCVLLGVPLALVLARARFPGKRLVRSLVLLPLVLPPVVGGIALLYTFGRQGLLGGALEAMGVQVAFSTAAVVLAQTFVALPFLVLTLEAPCGPPERAMRPWPRRSEHARGPSCAGLPYRWSSPAWQAVRCSPLPAAWANSVPPLPSQAACRGSRGPSRWKFTCSGRPTRTLRWRFRSCSSW